MKGLAIQQVFWILVVVIVIAVVGMLIIKEQLLASEEGEELETMFGKEILTTYGDEELEVESDIVDSNYQYTVRVENLNFYYKKLEEDGEEELQFVAVADFKKRVAIAKENDHPKIISYPEDKNVELNFSLVSTKEPEDKEFLHLTFWRDSKCIDDFFEEGEEFRECERLKEDIDNGMIPCRMYEFPEDLKIENRICTKSGNTWSFCECAPDRNCIKLCQYFNSEFYCKYSGGGGGAGDFYDLLAKCAKYYISSVDVMD